jgi:RHS repeat-associated protein
MKKYSWRHQAISFDKQGRFTSHEFDVGTGLNYMDARYQAPTLSRFLSEDPKFLATTFDLKNPQSLNTTQTTASVLNSASGFGLSAQIGRRTKPDFPYVEKNTMRGRVYYYRLGRGSPRIPLPRDTKSADFAEAYRRACELQGRLDASL